MNTINKETLDKLFTYAHLPENLQAVSKPFCDIAQEMWKLLPDNDEKFFTLRKLMESKDCAVRAHLLK